MKKTLNLLPVDIGVKLPPARKKTYYLFLGTGVYILLIIGLWFSNILETRKIDIELKKLDSIKKELSNKLSAIPRVVATGPSLEQEITEAMKKTPPWSRIVSEISLIVPEEVWLSSIDAKGEKEGMMTVIKGFSLTQMGVAKFISSLEDSNYFENVEIVFSQMGERNVSFELKAHLRWS